MIVAHCCRGVIDVKPLHYLTYLANLMSKRSLGINHWILNAYFTLSPPPFHTLIIQPIYTLHWHTQMARYNYTCMPTCNFAHPHIHINSNVHWYMFTCKLNINTNYLSCPFLYKTPCPKKII